MKTKQYYHETSSKEFVYYFKAFFFCTLMCKSLFLAEASQVKFLTREIDLKLTVPLSDDEILSEIEKIKTPGLFFLHL
jgi:hypothetical protein